MQLAIQFKLTKKLNSNMVGKPTIYKKNIMIVDYNDFKRDARIPDLFNQIGGGDDAVNVATRTEFKDFMAHYEREYLEKFGFDVDLLYQQIREGISEEVLEFANSLKVAIANYIAFHYFRSNSVKNTGLGGVVLVPNQSLVGDLSSKCVSIWNEMVEIGERAYVKKNGYFPLKSDIFAKINIFGI